MKNQIFNLVFARLCRCRESMLHIAYTVHKCMFVIHVVVVKLIIISRNNCKLQIYHPLDISVLCLKKFDFFLHLRNWSHVI